MWKLLLHDSLPRMSLNPSMFCLCFHLLRFILPPFEEIGLPFWVPGVLCQHSEVVLWKLLNIQMIFEEFVGEKVASPSHSSATLELHLSITILKGR